MAQWTFSALNFRRYASRVSNIGDKKETLVLYKMHFGATINIGNIDYM